MMHSTYTTNISEDGVTEFWVTVKPCPKVKLEIHKKGTFTFDPLVALTERHAMALDSGLVVHGDVYELHVVFIFDCIPGYLFSEFSIPS